MRTYHRETALAEQPTCVRRSRDIAELAADSAPCARKVGRSFDGALFREHAEAMFGDAPDGIMLQLDGRIVYANRRMAALTGHADPARLIGRIRTARSARARCPAGCRSRPPRT